MDRSKYRRVHGRSLRQLKLHHACTCFIALLCCAHLLAVLWTIKYEEVWAGLNARQKLGRSLHILLFDSYLSRTKPDNRAACPITDFVPKVSEPPKRRVSPSLYGCWRDSLLPGVLAIQS